MWFYGTIVSALLYSLSTNGAICHGLSVFVRKACAASAFLLEDGQVFVHVASPDFRVLRLTGWLFWASTCKAYMQGVDPYVVALDIDAAAVVPSSRIVPLPTEAVAAGSPDDYEIQIAWWGETGSCLIQYRKPAFAFALWLLATTKTNEEDATATTATAWKKICEVGIEEIKLRKRHIGSFTLINRDILIFITLQRCPLYGYSLSSRQLKKLRRVDSPYSALIPYANTLRPCSRDDKVIAEK
ncbi:uncharacterized protein LOC109721513 [Ananas comosus]|uniref:Uncharacterized protein LOC109721513 n=1 Tax=Ananas comosus TaxID=4615 RepID=A0A6P5GFK2_ANACO|nr:uncharacterized protein LOC109721513 [Ananas comosus]